LCSLGTYDSECGSAGEACMNCSSLGLTCGASHTCTRPTQL
jgi:hypothetical protein